ncbi:MAG: bifunctional glutamate N-acetyltransferase/amino-acid acetyltransferase ArgJ [Candidatus Omnitrophica bacterium]|nr:bifunctional glutamate N-acetyltransferase/amino-acid acetyltransferase ArgJ [Candidatus Omnitrophota bacterium]MCM8799505.1 bifunctional glutamate N-acetyltransferase/amino-acid acetyltransferase ArgJ [Candidatus Omnitrophota bacterium]
MKIYKRIFLPQGFKANGLASGIKKPKRLDLALFYSEIPAKASCLFTLNQIQSASIKVDKQQLKRSKIFRTIIVNSGNANCFTGKEGIKDTKRIISELAKILKIKKEEILVASTGIIGKRLKLRKIIDSLPKLVDGLSYSGIDKAKRAILTTDTFIKEATIEINLNRKIILSGVAKGAGMIFPNLATMLCFIFTDASLTQRALDTALKIAVENSFNRISVDGCMSTNDTVIILANGLAGNKIIDKGTKYFDIFSKALNRLCSILAELIIRDAEGATKFIKIKVKEAKDVDEAKKIAFTIANSPLFKSALYGENPNLGRIVSAIGSTGIKIDERNLKIKMSSLKKKDIYLEINLKRGRSSTDVLSCDLSPDYIKINAGYN